jgi:hypothetical protein
MTAHLKLRIRVSEPWDFERQTGLEELIGWTVDHVDDMNEEWEVTLDQGFEFHDRRIGRLLVNPRYVGEALSRVFDAIAGFPVRIAHRRDGSWHYAFTGMMAIRHDDPTPAQDESQN